MQSQFFAAINQLCDEKNLPRETVMEAIQAALRAAYRKDYGHKDQNIDVEFGGDESESITVYLIQTVVDEVEDENLEISLKDAKKIKKTAKVGDEIRTDVTPVGYGRIAAQAAKQVIIQRLQEAERNMMYEMFKDRENELLNALVHRVENRNVYINLEQVTALLTPDQQIPREHYYGGQRLKVYLDKVIKTTKGPQLLISRTHPNLIRKLMELEIPEIAAGNVTINEIAREAGVRCKIAVSSKDEKIDPVGSCVGQKGVRIQSIMDELNGERIDIILWEEDKEKFITAALAPAKVTKMDIDEEEKRVKVYVNTDQRPLAIGKNGQNVRLASKLTGYEIDILDIAELGEIVDDATEAVAAEAGVADLKDVSPEVVEILTSAGLSMVSQIKGLKVSDLMDIGLSEDDAQSIIEKIKA